MKHNYKSLQKYVNIYDAFRALRKSTYEEFPQFRGAISANWFYRNLAERFELTPNYICSIIKDVEKNEIRYRQELINRKHELLDE